MFNGRRVTFTKDARSYMTADQYREVLAGQNSTFRSDATLTVIYDHEDQAIRAARFLMNKDVPYVQRG